MNHFYKKKNNNYLLTVINLYFLILGAPVYLSFPHFYKADPKLLDAVHGLKPDRDTHETYFKIQPVSVRL